jgi:4-hydroxy-tetrahydrodipicolinate reductase
MPARTTGGDVTTGIPVVHYGLGPIGIEVARLTARRGDLTSVAGVEIDERLVGRQLQALTGAPAHAEIVLAAALPDPAPGTGPVVLLCTGSSLESVMPQLLECVAAGYQVVSTCEELSHPWHTHPDLATLLDTAAVAGGVTVLGTGVNPGYAMDFLPIALTATCHTVTHVAVHRVQDAGARRLPLQRKVGAGMSRAEFAAAAAAGRVRHVGLPESVWSIADALGWSLDQVTETLEPVLAPRELASGLGPIRAGQVAGVRQIARGLDGSGERVVLTLEMAVGLDRPRDEVRISGVPGLRAEIPGGLPGDLATAAVVVNCVPQVVAATPGLKTMADLPPPRPAPTVSLA